MNIRKGIFKAINGITSFIFIIVGALFIAGGIFFATYEDKITREETTATIVKIEEYYDYTSSDNTTSYHVYVNYEVDGKKYENIELGSYTFTYKEGKEIKIKYNVDNPLDIMTGSPKLFPLVFVGTGTISVVIGIYPLINKAINRARGYE